MKPLDPRLLSYARGTRLLLISSVLVGMASIAAIIAQAMLLAWILTAVIMEGADLAAVLPSALWLAVVVLVRAVIVSAGEEIAGRMAHGIIARMRRQLLTHISGFGLRRPAGMSSAGLAQVAGPGLDAVQQYLTGYLPQLVLAALVPLSMVAVLAWQDLISAGIVAVTLPLIPLFMALVGWYTNRQAASKLKVLQRLSHHFLDVVAGLPTLKVYGRAESQARAVGAVTERYRKSTMATLRVAFLSSLVLEVLATLSVALVAVTMGVRLVNGSVGLQVGLTVLILAPEAYFPLRALGTRFHAAADGVAAVEQALEVLNTPVVGRTDPVVGRAESRPPLVGRAGRSATAPPLVGRAGRSATAPPLVGRAGRSATVSRPPEAQPAVELYAAGVSYDGRGGVAPVDLVLEAGTMTALIGPSGSGKTTILAMIAGAVIPDRGTVVRATGTVAYAGQNSFLIAGTVRENLLLGNESCGDERLQQALHDAAAEFVHDLPDGWETRLTDDGASLSSGQKQRLVLARTLARDADLVLLDEPTATLDATTEATVLLGLSRALRGRTVLLVTHRSAARAIADRVVELTPDGLVERGLDTVAGQPARPTTGARPARPTTGAGLDTVAGQPARPTTEAQPARPTTGAGLDTVAGQPARPTTNARLTAWEVLKLARPQWVRLAVATLLGVLATACAVALMAVSAWLIARAAQQPPILTLMVAVVGVRAFGVGRGVLRYAERLLSHDAALRVLTGLREAIVARLATIAPSGLPLWRRSDLLGRLVNDVDDIQELLLRGILPLAGASVVCGVTVGVFAVILPAAGAALALCLVVTAVAVPLWLAARADLTQSRVAVVHAERTGLITDTVANAVDLQLLGALPSRWNRLQMLEAKAHRLARRQARDAGVAAAAAVLGGGAASVLSVLIATPAVESGALPAVLLAVLALTPLALVEPTTGIGSAGAAIAKARAAAGRVMAVLSASEPLRSNGTQDLPAGPGRIELRDVSARWPGADRDAISGVNLVIEPGDRVCVLGPSGSGKSTLLAILLGFVPPSAGTVLVDGIDAGRIDQQAWRRQFGWTGQDAHLFATSIAENLRVADPGADSAAVTGALAMAGWAKWWQSAPNGIDVEVGEHGAALSGGERQRLLLARALLADRPVLLADEPTAHLDTPTGDALMTSLLESGRTTVLVTHREQDALSCNKVLRLGRDGTTADYSELSDLIQVP